MAGQIMRKEGERLKALAKRYADDGIGWEAKVREFYSEQAAEMTERYDLGAAAVASYNDGAANDVIETGIQAVDAWGDDKTAALTALLLEASS
jgi:hypothetical protein